MLDDEQGVAALAEGFEGVEEFDVVARMESDGGFVQNVENATEIGAELCGEADALGLTT